MATSPIPVFSSIFSSSQSIVTLSLSHKEKKPLLNQGNSFPPLKSRQNPKFRTFIWYSKVPGEQIVGYIDKEGEDEIATKNNPDFVAKDFNIDATNLDGYPDKEGKNEIPTENTPDFVPKDCSFDASNLDGYTKIAMRKGTNNTNLNSDTKPNLGNLQVGDYVKRILSLPIEERIKVLDLLQCDNKSLTISDYNDISYALLRAGEFDSVISIFNELKSNGITPDARSFSILINCYYKKNDPFEAKRVMEEMLENKFKPNVVTFSIIIHSFSKKGRVSIALQVLDKMRQLNVNPTTNTYNYLLKGLCYVGRLEEAYQLVQNLKNTPTKPDIYTYTLIIDAYCKVGMVDKSLEIFNESNEMGLEPTIFTYNALLNGFSKEKRPKEALSILIEMYNSNKILPDITSYNRVLTGLLRNREIPIALKTFKKMKDSGFIAGQRTLNSLLRGLCRLSITHKGFLNDAKIIFEMIKELGFGPSTYTYCLMIQALGKSGEVDKAVVYLNEMVSSGTSPRILTYNMIIRLLCRNGRVYEALGVVVLMIKCGKMPSSFSFSIILNEFCKQKMFLEAFGVYSAALKRGLDPSWRFKNELVCKNDLKIVTKERKEEEEKVFL